MNKQILILMTTFSVLSAQAQIKYPQTPRDNTVDEYFGVKGNFERSTSAGIVHRLSYQQS